MCLAVPARIIEVIDAERAIVDIDGVRNEISTALIDDAAVDDYVIVHVGFAINRLDVAEAERSLAMIDRLRREAGAEADALRD